MPTPSTFDQIRAEFPEWSQLNDAELVSAVSKTVKLDPQQVAQDLGMQISKPGLWSDVKRGTGQMLGAMGSTARDLGADRVGRAVEGVGAGMALRNPSQINDFSDVVSKPGTTIREAVGENAPQMGLSLGAGMLGRVAGGAIGALTPVPGGALIGQNVGGLAAGYLAQLAQEYGGIRQEQREQGIEDKTRALGAAAPAAAMESFLGPEALANKIGRKGLGAVAKKATEEGATGFLKHAAKEVGKNAVIEGPLTEFPQTVLERWGAHKNLTDADALNEYGVATAKGAAGGGAYGGAMSPLTRPRAPALDDRTQPTDLLNPPPVVGAPVDTDLEVGLGIIPPTNPYNVAGYVDAFNQGQDTELGSDQGGLFGSVVDQPWDGSNAPVPAAAPTLPGAVQSQIPDYGAQEDAGNAAAPAAPAVPSKLFTPEEQEVISVGLVPTKKSLALVSDLKAHGVEMTPEISQAAAENKWGKVKTLLAQAVIAKNQAPAAAPVAPAAAPVAPQAPTQAIAQPSIQASTQAPAVEAAPAQAEMFAPEAAPAAVAPTPAEPVAPAAPVAAPAAPAEPVVQRTGKKRVVVAPQQPASVWVAPEAAAETAPQEMDHVESWEDMKPEGAPAFSQLAKPLQEAWVKAGEVGKRSMDLAEQIHAENADDAAGDDTLETLNTIFGERDAAMLYDRYVNNLSEEQIANKTGLSRQAVAKVTGEGSLGQKTRAARIAAAAKKNGWTDEYVKSLAGKLGQKADDAAPGEVVDDYAEDTADAEEGAEPREETGDEFQRGDEFDDTYGNASYTDDGVQRSGGTVASIGGAQSNWKDTDSEAQRAVEALDKAADLAQRVAQAEAAGKDAVSIGNKLVPLADIEAQVAELQQAAAQALQASEAALKAQNAKAREVERLDAKPEAPKKAGPQRVRKDANAQVSKQAAPAQDAEVLTRQERAERAWNQAVATIPGAPKWDEVPPSTRRDFAGFEAKDQTRQDVVALLQKAQPTEARFGKDSTGAVDNHYTAADLIAELRDFMRADVVGRKLRVVDTVGDLLADADPAVRAVGAALKLEGAYGVAADGRAYLVADRIAKGSGRAKFLHEVGAHLGLDRLLTTAQHDSLVLQIVDWAKADDGSQESTLAAAAIQRAKAAGTSREGMQSEILAYFVEEAVQAGVDPTAATRGGSLYQWFRTLWAAFKSAVRRLGMKPEALTAQDVVNLAYGAARLEIAGTWHGTAANFRRFDHRYMGSGEGAQFFGWGTYLAQRKGTADWYWKQDLKRKNARGARTKVALANGAPLEGDLSYFASKHELTDFYGDELRPDWKEKLDALEAKLTAAMSRVQELTARAEQLKRERDAARDRRYALPFGSAEREAAADEALEAADRYEEARRAAADVKRELIWGGEQDLQSIKALRDAGGLVKPEAKQLEGTVKRVDVAVAPDEWLDWYKPLSKQSEHVRAALSDMGFDVDEDYDPTGEEVYKDLTHSTKSDKAASEHLDAYDVKGVRFADGASRTRGGGTNNFVVFNDKNIHRVGSMVANDRERMKFGKNVVSEVLKSSVGRSAQVRAGQALNAVIFTKDVIARAKALGMTAAAALQTAYEKRSALRGRLEQGVEDTAAMYHRLPEAERGTGRGSANQFLYDTTRGGLWYRQPSDFIPGWEHGPVQVDSALSDRYEALSPAGKKLVDAVFHHGVKMLREKQGVVDAVTNAEYDQRIQAAEDDGDMAKANRLRAAKAAELAQFKKLLSETGFRPYAPLKRFGPYVVVAKSRDYLAAEAAKDTKRLKQLEQDGSHYHVDFAEGPKEAIQMADKLRATGRYADVYHKTKEAERQGLFGGTLSAFNEIRTQIDKQGAEGAAVEKLRNLVSDLYLQALAEGSARKSELHRRGIAGDIDMLRSFASQGMADAMFVSSARYNGAADEAIAQMRKQREAGGDRQAKSDVFNELMARHMRSFEFDASPIANKLARLSSVWYLATSPAYYLQNATQPWVLSLPFMAGKHGYLRAAKALADGYKVLAPLLKDVKLGERFNFDAQGVPQDIRDLLKHLSERGLVDIGIEAELGRFKVDAQTRAGQALNAAMRLTRAASTRVEAFNRVSTAVAAYSLSRERGMSKEQATAYASEVLDLTHGDYTSLNAPRPFNTSLGKVALQFKKYQLIQLTLLAKLIKGSGFSTEDQRAALKALTFTVGHAAALGGAIGLPGWTFLSWAAGKIFGDEDEPEDMELALRRAVGEDLATLISRGIPAALGLDVSRSLGMGNALSVLPFADVDLSSQDGAVKTLAALLGGPLGALTAKAADGVGLLLKGDMMRGTAQLLPSGLGNVLKAVSEQTQGITRRNGDQLVAPEDISLLQSAMTAVGLKTTAAAERAWAAGVKIDYEQQLQDRAKAITGDYVRAWREGDTDAAADARAAWSHLQEARVANGLDRQKLSALLKAPHAQAKRERNTVDGIQANKHDRRFVESLRP